MKVIAIALLSVLCVRQEYDNPTFKYWSESKVGAWVKYKVVVRGKQSVEFELAKKVLEIGPEKVVLENIVRISVAGRQLDPEPPSKEEIKKKEAKWGPVEKEGEEEVEVAGNKLNCHWIVIAGNRKCWLSKDVPGGLVRLESKEGTTPVEMRLEVIDWAGR